MAGSLGLLARWTVYAGVSLCVLAACFGLMVGPEFDAREHVERRLSYVGGPHAPGAEPMFLNGQSGQFMRVVLPRGEELEHASVAPWRDGFGRSHMVGRWIRREGEGEARMPSAFGIGRFSFPDGLPIDRIVTQVTPTSPPIWFAGTESMILFPGTDGRLYRFDFGQTGVRDREPRRVGWEVPGLDAGDVIVCELTRCSDGRLPNLFVAAMRTRISDRPGAAFSPPRLWWLSLRADASTVEGAGPLTEATDSTYAPGRSETESGARIERYPTLANTADRGLALGFLTKDVGDAFWTLRVARVAHTESAEPMVSLGPARALIEDRCAATAPAFDPAGRFVYALADASRGDHGARGLILSAPLRAAAPDPAGADRTQSPP
jgi:hypothetical protein